MQVSVFAPMHPRTLSVGPVVVSGQMQETVDDEPADFVSIRRAEGGGLPAGLVEVDDDLPF